MSPLTDLNTQHLQKIHFFVIVLCIQINQGCSYGNNFFSLYRFVEALKQQLKEKMDKRGVELPPLCCCGMTLWDTNPDTCANNCVFYRNPKGV